MANSIDTMCGYISGFVKRYGLFYVNIRKPIIISTIEYLKRQKNVDNRLHTNLPNPTRTVFKYFIIWCSGIVDATTFYAAEITA